MGSLADMIAAMNTNFAMMEHLCCKAEAQRDAARARVRELEAEVAALKSGVAAANERWLEAKARVETTSAVREWQAGQENPLPDDACGKRLSEQVARFPDEQEPAPLREGLAGAWVGDPPVQVFPLTGTAAEDKYRTAVYIGGKRVDVTEVRIDFDGVRVVVPLEALGETIFAIVTKGPEPARPTVLGFPVKVADLPDGVLLAMKDEAGHVAAVVNATIPSTPEPAPSPDDAARARIAAAGAKLYEGRALRVEAANGVWSTRSVVEDEEWVLDELADFAEAHRAAQEPPGDAPEAPAEG